MDSSLTVFNYNGSVISRREDGFINLTQMCQANGKRIDHWKELKATQSYINELQENYPGSRVVYAEGGANGGTWGHPSLAINLARWISPKFAVWCDAHIFNLMATGQTSLDVDPLEEMRLKLELLKLENNRNQSELSLLQFRQSVVTMCPEPIQQRILGYQTVKEIEYRDRIFKGDQIINDGGTVTKTELCKRYGLLKNGKPDYKALNFYLEDSGLASDPDAWELSAYIQENNQLKRDYIPVLDDHYQGYKQRNRYIVEQ